MIPPEFDHISAAPVSSPLSPSAFLSEDNPHLPSKKKKADGSISK